MYLLLLLVQLLVVCNAVDKKNKDVLKRNVNIDSYDITIDPLVSFGKYTDPNDNSQFNGSVKIQFSFTEDTNIFDLRAAPTINITKTEIRSYKEWKSFVIDHTWKRNEENKNKDQIDFVATKEKFSKKLWYLLEIQYSGTIGWNNEPGIFKHCIGDGQTNCQIGTYFKPSYARNAFPCFDDPYFKSIFNLNLVHHNDAKVYSNAQIKSQSSYGLKTQTLFHPTPKISTYMLSFAIGEFIESKAVSKSGVEVKSVNYKNFANLNKETSVIGAQCIDTLETLIGVKIPTPKWHSSPIFTFVDTLTYPDYDGLEGYSFAFNPRKGFFHANENLMAKFDNIQSLCHFVAHQWFGNMVTVDKWGLEFLHEGFAAFFQNQAIAEFKGFGEFVNNYEATQRIRALESEFIHPLVDINSNFDDVTEKYGAQVIHQIYNIIGRENFYKSLKMYLTMNSYKTVELSHFYNAFFYGTGGRNFCGKLRFKEFVDDYLFNKGYPEVTVDYINGNYKVTQKNALWNVPLFVLDLESNKEELLWLLKDGSFCSKTNFQLRPTGKYVFNNNAKSIVNVIYNEKAWNRIWSSDLTRLTARTQYTLLVEYKKNNNVEWDTVLELMLEVVKQNNGKVHSIVIDLVVDLLDLEEPQLLNATETAIFDLISKAFDISDDSVNNQALGRVVFYLLRFYKFPATCRQTEVAFEKFQKDCKKASDVYTCSQIPIEFRTAVYLHGASTKAGLAFLEDYYERIENSGKRSLYSPELNRLRTVFVATREDPTKFYC